ncbi:hypothetical protein AK830_g7733 [Neonectria ditissima]|uniref:GED domain-containing protein n=1 Tax=Neonectria ditissima TaxID=78410 RepID=A0A0P7BEG9_9HYPO|nr:hypothetical protein AK830_g7733 [Neonectria ditissima]
MSLSTEESIRTPSPSPPRNRAASSVNGDSPNDSGVEGLSSKESTPGRARHRKQVNDEEAEAKTADASEDVLPKKQPNVKPVTENPFDTERGRALFAAMDKLQGLKCGKELEIPNLIVVGGQSSGKSSLLQSLTGIPFPVGATCCTRFPTRITSKRTSLGSKDSFRITIEPAEVTIEGLVRAPETIRKYECVGDTFTADVFVKAANEVSSKYMGIRQGKDEDSNNFAAEVLKVELSGPNRPHFSILDLPGHFNSTYDVNKSDQAIIEDMIVKYMQKTENTVICVLDASNDLAHQPILELAHEHIQDKERIVGVFTKCDRLSNNLAEARHAVSIAQGEDLSTYDPRFMRDGWFIVRNRSDQDPAGIDLNVAEKTLFRTAPWSKIPETRRGSAALKVHLGAILNRKIESGFPVIRDEISGRLHAKQAEKDILGEPRDSHDSMLNYASTIARSYESKAMLALDHPGRLKIPSMELRQEVRRLNEEFDRFMRAKGATWDFQDYDVNPRAKLAELNFTDGNPQARPHASPRKGSPGFDESFAHYTKMQSSEDLLRQIEEQLVGFQANQLPGIVNPDIFPAMYQLQVAKWLEIARIHLSRVKDTTATCIVTILESVCPATGGTERLFTGLRGLLEQSFHSANAQTDERCLIQCEQETKCTILQTTDPKFEEDIIGWRRVRFQQALLAATHHKGPSATEALAKCFDLAHPSLKKNMVNEVHDVLKVYYKISLETFIRTITNMVETYVSGVDGPVRALRPECIMQLSKQDIERLAGEDPSTLRKRRVLKEEIEELTRALDIVEYARRHTESLL